MIKSLLSKKTSVENRFVELMRPIRRSDGSYETAQLRRFTLKSEPAKSLTVLEGEHVLQFSHPPAISLDTDDSLETLRLLEYAGVRYLNPECPAAGQGVNIFQAARRFAIEHAPEWTGFDWDFTTNIYKIYGPLVPLIVTKFISSPPAWIQQKTIKLFEAAKPGMHELIMGMAVGYALRQGLRSFDQWEYYQSQVRFVTQTWPDRLAKMGTGAIALIPLMMGRLPGQTISEEDVRNSDAFITLEDFLSQIKKLLRRFIDGGYKFHLLSAREQDEVMDLLKAGRAFKLKPLSTFAAKGWLPPTLIFDDSPNSNARFLKEGIRVVGTINPVVPGKEINDVKALSIKGRKAAADQIVRMASFTEGPAMIGVLQRLAKGETNVLLSTKQLTPTPEGSVLTIFDLGGPISDMLFKFKIPQRQINHLIKAIIKKVGGISRVEKNYLDTASLRLNNTTQK